MDKKSYPVLRVFDCEIKYVALARPFRGKFKWVADEDTQYAQMREQLSMTKTFDWAHFSERHKPQWSAWLKTNHARTVTAGEYMEAYRAQRSADTRPYKARRYATTKLRQCYRNLQEDFGFFV